MRYGGGIAGKKLSAAKAGKPGQRGGVQDIKGFDPGLVLYSSY